MWKITAELKKHLQEKFSLAADAGDDTIRKMVGEKIAAGELSIDDLQRLTTVKASEAELKVKSMIDAANAPILAAVTALTETVKALKPDAVPAGGTPTETKATSVTPPAGSDPAPTAPAGQKLYALAGTVSASAIDEPVRVRVKSVLEQFNDTRTLATFDKAFKPIKSLGSEPITKHFEGLPYTLDMPTERSKAIAGVWFKAMALKQMRQKGMEIPGHYQFKEFERDILTHVVHECRFVGEVSDGYEYEGQKLFNDLHRKAVLDDSLSGGLEAVPIEFDAAVILTPLLQGELFPFVDVRTVTRRRLEAVAVGNPTMSWGVAEGTAISLFDTDGFISAFDNSIYPISGAIELGLDFLADSPVAIGTIVVQKYGERFRQEMDNAIATGNGTNRPEGVFTTAGVTTVTPAGGAGAAQTVGDYESLRFGVAKEYRQEAGLRAMYIGTDTSYSRARGIPVDSSNDQRRVFGIMDQEDYMLFQRRYAVNESLTNAQIGYFCLNRYRMYRRQGLEFRLVTEDWTLARQNKQGIVVRARFGGRLEQAAAGAKITAGQV
jgi:HK97 family phage major capsid protein